MHSSTCSQHTDPQFAYDAIKTEATRLAGGPEDILQRMVLHHSLYQDSGRNHVFPLLALHGGLWAYGFFEVTGKLGKMIQYRYFYDSRERAYRMNLLNQFAVGFRMVNRSVFIDTYTNYHFTKQYVVEPGSVEAIQPALHRALNHMHALRAAGEMLEEAERRQLYLLALKWEQEVTVAPGVQAEIARFDCPILRSLCLRPILRFAYFPPGAWMIFRNFGDAAERIRHGTRCYDLAVQTGWPHVVASMRRYHALPEAYFNNIPGFTEQMRDRIQNGFAAIPKAS